MTRSQETSSRQRKRGFLSRLSRWVQQRANARTNERIRRGEGSFRGMNLMILHTSGRQSGQPRETPVSWFADGEEGWLIVASGGGKGRHPHWHLNLMAAPERASIELPGGDTVAVEALRLERAARDEAWQRITAAQPRFEKYQRKTDHEYPVIRLRRRG